MRVLRKQRRTGKETILIVEKDGITKLQNRDKIFFTCNECGRKTSKNKESFSFPIKEMICSQCKRERTNKLTYGCKIALHKDIVEILSSKTGTHKMCSACRKVKPFEKFTKNKTKSNGYDSLCLECNSLRARKWNKNNSVKKKNIDKKYREKNKERLKDKSRKYYNENRNAIINKNKTYYKCNKEEVKARVSKYGKTNVGKEVKRNSQGKRRSKCKETDITTEWLLELKKNTKRCVICGIELTDNKCDNQYNLDHIVPLCSGGPHVKENVRYICRACNLSRPKRSQNDKKMNFDNERNKLYYLNYLNTYPDNFVLPYRFLSGAFTEIECEEEFKNVINKPGKYNSNACYNKNIINFQKHFYKVENELWEDQEIRKRIVKNRMYYLNAKHGKSAGIEKPENLNDKEILRGFKISGEHIGFSHFSPLWIKAFIEEFNVKSIYDFCGGWGQRLIGAWHIDYYYNDIEEETVYGVINIFNKYEKLNNGKKLFFNKDSSEFIPDFEYDSVFTCPPYWTTEKYFCKNTSTKKFDNYNDWLNIWWRKSIKNSLTKCRRYFSFVINNNYKYDMNRICEEEGLKFLCERRVGVRALNHFQRSVNNSFKGESIQIFSI